jgi:hypothetical protein
MITTPFTRSAIAAMATLSLVWPGAAVEGAPIQFRGPLARPATANLRAQSLPKELLFIPTEAGTIDIYPLKNPSGPIQSISGLTASQDQMVTDGAGNLYVVNNGASANDLYVSVFAPPYTGSPAILNTIWNSQVFFPQGVAVDGAGTVYVSSCGTYCSETPAVYKYPLGSTSPTQQITSPAFDSLAGLTADAHGNVYALEWSSSTFGMDVFEIKAGSTTPKPLHLHGLFTGNGGNGLSLDGLGNLYVANNSSGSDYILEFKLGTHNAERLIDSMPFAQGPEMIDVGPDGNLYVPVGCSFTPCPDVYGFKPQGRKAFEAVGNSSTFILGVATFPNLLLKGAPARPGSFVRTVR